MRTANWMTREPISILPTTSLARCQKLMKMNNIRRLPVVDDMNHVVGIVSDRDVKSATPSDATSLEVHELQYLVANVQAADIMTRKPVTARTTDSIASVAAVMLDRKIGGLPVVDENNCLVGMITEMDIFKSLLAVSGANIEGIDITVHCGDEPGTLASLLNIIYGRGGRIISVLTSFLKDGSRLVFLRMHPLADPSETAMLRAELEASTEVVEWAQ